MKDQMIHLAYTVELAPGEKLSLPPALVEGIGPGRWLVTVRPVHETDPAPPTRLHDAFLSGYAPEDEGLYDDFTGWDQHVKPQF
ncbi:MAG: hypothetical protein HY040_29125 [Planctomycetes bacterium]|nr:hypothetical protein [Planctomycetota bacterium]